jgi:hypothetical protein
MAEDLRDSVSGTVELVFPDDAAGKTYRLRELTVYDAEEVREDLDGDVPQYGRWLPVKEQETGDDAWLTAPSRLRSALVENDVQTGETFGIGTMKQTGTGQTDPYLVELTLPERRDNPGDQASLETATDGGE